MENVRLDKKVCSALNISRNELAQMLQVTPGTIANWKTDDDIPHITKLLFKALLDLEEKIALIDEVSGALDVFKKYLESHPKRAIKEPNFNLSYNQNLNFKSSKLTTISFNKQTGLGYATILSSFIFQIISQNKSVKPTIGIIYDDLECNWFHKDIENVLSKIPCVKESVLPIKVTNVLPCKSNDDERFDQKSNLISSCDIVFIMVENQSSQFKNFGISQLGRVEAFFREEVVFLINKFAKYDTPICIMDYNGDTDIYKNNFKYDADIWSIHFANSDQKNKINREFVSAKNEALNFTISL